MPNGTFVVEVSPAEGFTPTGLDRVVFRFSANLGEPATPLAEAASGGELSRLMLALNVVTGTDLPTLAFDEVDAGVGGRTAVAVGALLKRLASDRQVLVVTHLPQLAARAHTHFQVRKDTDAHQAVTDVAELEGEMRVTEIARMLGGDPESRTSREHARELLEAGT